MSNLKNCRFGFINQTDEDDANRRIKEHLYRDERPAARAVGGLTAAPAKRAEPKPMSDLARFVLAVQRVCESQRLRSRRSSWHAGIDRASLVRTGRRGLPRLNRTDSNKSAARSLSRMRSPESSSAGFD